MRGKTDKIAFCDRFVHEWWRGVRETGVHLGSQRERCVLIATPRAGERERGEMTTTHHCAGIKHAGSSSVRGWVKVVDASDRDCRFLPALASLSSRYLANAAGCGLSSVLLLAENSQVL